MKQNNQVQLNTEHTISTNRNANTIPPIPVQLPPSLVKISPISFQYLPAPAKRQFVSAKLPFSLCELPPVPTGLFVKIDFRLFQPSSHQEAVVVQGPSKYVKLLAGLAVYYRLHWSKPVNLFLCHAQNARYGHPASQYTPLVQIKEFQEAMMCSPGAST